MNQIRKIQRYVFILVITLFPFVVGQYARVFASDIREKAKRGVVKIQAYKPDNVVETGAGVIVAIKDQKIHIMTAYHVIENSSKIIVKFYDHPTEKFESEQFDKFDEQNDLAVVFVKYAKMPMGISKLSLGKVTELHETDEVYAIGHPLEHEWELSKSMLRLPEHRCFRFGGEAVDPGNSGGALVNKKYQILGIVVGKQPRDGIALKIDIAAEILRRWQIPFELRSECKKWPWIVGGGVAVGIVTAIIWYKECRNRNRDDGTFPVPPGRPK